MMCRCTKTVKFSSVRYLVVSGNKKVKQPKGRRDPGAE